MESFGMISTIFRDAVQSTWVINVESNFKAEVNRVDMGILTMAVTIYLIYSTGLPGDTEINVEKSH
jgi:hypothetical protein